MNRAPPCAIWHSPFLKNNLLGGHHDPRFRPSGGSAESPWSVSRPELGSGRARPPIERDGGRVRPRSVGDDVAVASYSVEVGRGVEPGDYAPVCTERVVAELGYRGGGSVFRRNGRRVRGGVLGRRRFGLRLGGGAGCGAALTPEPKAQGDHGYQHDPYRPAWRGLDGGCRRICWGVTHLLSPRECRNRGCSRRVKREPSDLLRVSFPRDQ